MANSIWVLAGVNGCGKSSIAGAAARAGGADYFNPDEAARKIRAANPGATQRQANGAAWSEGKRLLERAIAERLDFAFETTLGGHTMTALLERAIAAGAAVRIWYAGLDTVERHLARVAARVARGGHDIPEDDIRRRWDASRANLIRLLPTLAELRLYDNSLEADPAAGQTPSPRLLLHLDHGDFIAPRDLAATPPWAKPIVAAALRI